MPLIEYIARTDSRNRVTLPVEVRQRLGVDPFDSITFVLYQDGRVEVRRTESGSEPRSESPPMAFGAPDDSG